MFCNRRQQKHVRKYDSQPPSAGCLASLFIFPMITPVVVRLINWKTVTHLLGNTNLRSKDIIFWWMFEEKKFVKVNFNSILFVINLWLKASANKMQTYSGITWYILFSRKTFNFRGCQKNRNFEIPWSRIIPSSSWSAPYFPVSLPVQYFILDDLFVAPASVGHAVKSAYFILSPAPVQQTSWVGSYRSLMLVAVAYIKKKTACTRVLGWLSVVKAVRQCTNGFGTIPPKCARFVGCLSEARRFYVAYETAFLHPYIQWSRIRVWYYLI